MNVSSYFNKISHWVAPFSENYQNPVKALRVPAPFFGDLLL